MTTRDRLPLRPATADEILAGAISDEPGDWIPISLRVSAGAAQRAARQMWGIPQARLQEGQMVWQLRTNDRDRYPVNLATDEDTAALLFSALRHPTEAAAEELAERVDDILRELSRPSIANRLRGRSRADSQGAI